MNINMLLLLLVSLLAKSQSIEGKWNTFDDKTGEHKSVIKIYKKENQYHGKVVHIINESKRYQRCTNCKGMNKDKPVLDMTVIYGLKKVGNMYKDGKVLDPETGLIYNCNITKVNDDKLQVRGYVWIAALGRSQTWTRAK